MQLSPNNYRYMPNNHRLEPKTCTRVTSPQLKIEIYRMKIFYKPFLVTVLVLLGSLNLQSQFVDFSTTHSSYVDGGGTWDVFDVYANFSDDQYALLNVFNADISSDDSEGFHHNDNLIGVDGTWLPSASIELLEDGIDPSNDSYVNVGYGVGAEASSNNTTLDPNFNPQTGPYVPMNAGWYNGNPSNAMYAPMGQIHVGRFVTEAFRSVYFTFEAEVGYHTGPGTEVFFGEGFTDANAVGVTGCTVTTACNYDSTATEDDGSCVLPDGCTDSTACNYDSTAGCDDGSCEFISCWEPPNSGCTYASATNYDSTATIDDGSCVFEVCDITSNDQDVYDQGYADGVASVPENTCPEDLDNDGAVNVQDVLLFLAAYGTICE